MIPLSIRQALSARGYALATALVLALALMFVAWAYGIDPTHPDGRLFVLVPAYALALALLKAIADGAWGIVRAL